MNAVLELAFVLVDSFLSVPVAFFGDVALNPL